MLLGRSLLAGVLLPIWHCDSDNGSEDPRMESLRAGPRIPTELAIKVGRRQFLPLLTDPAFPPLSNPFAGKNPAALEVAGKVLPAVRARVPTALRGYGGGRRKRRLEGSWALAS